MHRLGDKVAARNLAVSVGVPVMPASDPLPHDPKAVAGIAAGIGYPLMLKASWGGGGRGMRVIRDEAALLHDIDAARREAKAAFGRDEVYLEKLVERARHVEVQILADRYGSIVHLFERDCTVQRRHQKVVERAPAPYLDADKRQELAAYAVAIAHAANYAGAGTVEFLMDADTGKFYFIEVNPAHPGRAYRHRAGDRHRHRQGADPDRRRRGDRRHRLPECRARAISGSTAMPSSAGSPPRIPEQNFIPDYGRITAYRGATGFGIRLDGGTAYSGAVITRYYDPLLEKVTAWAPTPEETIARMDRALREFRIRGVATNLAFLENVITHPKFRDASYTTRFIDETPELFEAVKRRDRATKLLTYHRRRHRQRPSRHPRPSPRAPRRPGSAAAEIRFAARAAPASKWNLQRSHRTPSP